MYELTIHRVAYHPEILLLLSELRSSCIHDDAIVFVFVT